MSEWAKLCSETEARAYYKGNDMEPLDRNAVLEEAAKVCDRQAEMYTTERNKHEGDGPAWVRWNSKAYVCESNAQAIRALKKL